MTPLDEKTQVTLTIEQLKLAIKGAFHDLYYDNEVYKMYDNGVLGYLWEDKNLREIIESEIIKQVTKITNKST